jgi:hypothetical protein
MKATLKRAASFGGIDYPAGVHDLPSEALKGCWFADALKAEGVLIVREAEAPEVDETEAPEVDSPRRGRPRKVAE